MFDSTAWFPTGRESAAAGGGTSADRPIRAAAHPDPTKAETDTTMLLPARLRRWLR